jgi:hypothetical protein
MVSCSFRPHPIVPGLEIRPDTGPLTPDPYVFKIRQLTDVSHCNLQQHFYRNR